VKYLAAMPELTSTANPHPASRVMQKISFNVMTQLYLLVSDQALSAMLDNLNVNVDNTFRKYVPPNGILSTTNSGQCYNFMYFHEVKDPASGFMMRISVDCNETHL
jgi:hypothetical protein